MQSTNRAAKLRRYYLTLVACFGSLIWFGWGAWPLPPVGPFFIPIWIMIALATYFVLWRYTCSECGLSLISNKMTFGEKEVWGHALIPPRTCPSCGDR